MTTYTTTRNGNHIEYGKDFVCDIGDIAYSLSRICRFNGHTNEFYSVCSHSIVVSSLCNDLFSDRELTKAALLHDAQEAYIGDLASPIKHLPELEGYCKIEEWFADSIRQKLNLKYYFDDKRIKLCDKVAMLIEAMMFLDDSRWARDELLLLATNEPYLDKARKRYFNEENIDKAINYLKEDSDFFGTRFYEAEEAFLKKWEELNKKD